MFLWEAHLSGVPEAVRRAEKFCQVPIFGRIFGSCVKHHQRKNSHFVETRRGRLCRLQMDIMHGTLCKTPVDKPVEIVEKFEFSTVTP